MKKTFSEMTPREQALLNSFQLYAMATLPGATPRGNWIDYHGRPIMTYAGVRETLIREVVAKSRGT